MSKSNLPVFPAAGFLKAVQADSAYVGGTITDLVDVTTDAVDGVAIKELFSSNDDSGLSADITIYLHDGSVSIPIGTVALAAQAGTVTATARDNLASLITSFANSTDANGNEAIRLETGMKLQFSLSAAPASGKVVNVACLGDKF